VFSSSANAVVMLSIATSVIIILFIFLPFLFFTQSAFAANLLFYLIRYPLKTLLFLFDDAKVRRFFEPNKPFWKIVCEHSTFIDTYQRIAKKLIFLYFRIKLAGI
jgi:hypothetical protein